MSAVHVDEQMLVSAVRYALGRSTYIVAVSTAQVKQEWWAMTDNARRTIQHDVKHALAPGTLLGFQCDHDEWVELDAWIADRGVEA